MAGPNGGARIGAGRKAGGKNRATVEREMRAARGLQSALDGGLLPLDVILARMRGEPLPSGKMPTDEQFRAAEAAAPYLHPRLASTDTTIKSDNVHRVISDEPKSEAEWVTQHATPANDAVAATLPEDEAETDAA